VDRGDGVCRVGDIVVVDVDYWPVARTPGAEEVSDVFYEIRGGAGTPFAGTFNEALLEVDYEEDGGLFGFGTGSCHFEVCVMLFESFDENESFMGRREKGGR